MEQSNSWLQSASIPSAAMLDRVIGLKFGAQMGDWLEETLLTPVSDIMGRPSKRFRAKLVHLGCLLTSQYSDLTDTEHEWCLRFGDLIEGCIKVSRSLSTRSGVTKLGCCSNFGLLG